MASQNNLPYNSCSTNFAFTLVRKVSINFNILSWRLWWLNFLLCRIKAFFSCFWCPLRKKEVAQEKKSTSKTLIKIKSYQRRILFSPICVLFKVKIMLVCNRVSTFLERVYATIINFSYSWKLWFVLFRWCPFTAQEGKRNEKKNNNMFHGYLEIFAGNAATKKLKLNSFGRHVAHLSIRIVSDYWFALLGLTF